jgi:hypothetical protein
MCAQDAAVLIGVMEKWTVGGRRVGDVDGRPCALTSDFAVGWGACVVAYLGSVVRYLSPARSRKARFYTPEPLVQQRDTSLAIKTGEPIPDRSARFQIIHSS